MTQHGSSSVLWLYASKQVGGGDRQIRHPIQRRAANESGICRDSSEPSWQEKCLATSLSWRDLAHATVMASHISASVVGGSEPAACVAACLACQRRFKVGEDSGEVVIRPRVFEHCPVESSSGLKLALGCSLRSSFVPARLSRVASVAPADECGVCVSVVAFERAASASLTERLL
jgi:hypothetical protein